jgi:hypothetical protein
MHQIENYPFANLEELAAAVRLATADAKAMGHHASTVYANARLLLTEDTLTDGSTVLNLSVIIGIGR